MAASGDTLAWPAWWQNDGGATATDADAAQSEAWMQGNDNSPVTVAQLELVAERARDYFDAELSSTGGAGSEIDELVAGFDDADNSKPATLAQLQQTAQPFYDRLMAAGWASAYPWSQPPPGPGDAGYDKSVYRAWQQAQDAVANLAQLEQVFGFDLGASTQTTIVSGAMGSSVSTTASAPPVPGASITAPATVTVAAPAGEDAASPTASAALENVPAVLEDASLALAAPDAASVDLIILTPLE